MWKPFLEQSQCTFGCIHWYLTSLWFKVYTKKWFQAYTCLQQGIHVYSTVVPYSRWIALCVQIWPCSAGSRSPQRLFLYKIISAWNFGDKNQVVFDHGDCKNSFCCTSSMQLMSTVFSLSSHSVITVILLKINTILKHFFWSLLLQLKVNLEGTFTTDIASNGVNLLESSLEMYANTQASK